jgi:hypothetical protein
VANLRFALAGVVAMATRELHPVRLRWGAADSDIGINRREVRPDGRVVIGHNPAGPVDRAVRVARFDRQDGRPLAILVNYACHPVVFGADSIAISADYVGHTRAVVEHATGAAMLFVQGACGDINPRQRATPGGRQAETLGVELAGAVLTAYATATPGAVAGIAAATTPVDLPLLQDASAIPGLISAQDRQALHPTIDQRLPWAATVSADPATGGLTTPIALQVLRLGDLAVVGIPAEPFVEIGLALQERGLGRPTMVAGYTNGCVGYVPMPAAYPLGGYEVSYSFAYYRLPAPLAPECAERIVDAGRRLLDV